MAAALEACRRPGCTGHIDGGFCDTCGMAPLPAAAAPKPAAKAAKSASAPVSRASAASGSAPARPGATRRTASTLTGTARSGSTSVSSTRKGMGAGLVAVPPVPARDPMTAVLKDASVAENKRFCAKCEEPVGRGRDGKPGRPEGFCRKCGHPFSFAPKLHRGDLVGGQYSVVGCLAHGGLGWIYLATDKNVSDRWVVLKGLLDTGDADAELAAQAERRYLAEVEHPAIVKIFNFVEHDGAGYIVMEYVGGRSLRDVLKDRRAATPQEPALPLDQALAYAIDILPALAYLHEKGLLFCDFKPDNVIQVGESLKLIDLGGVVRMDDQDSAIYGTVGYQAPEIAHDGPTVGSDLYTVGRALAVMSFDFPGYQKDFANALPDPANVPVLQQNESFWRLLSKATAADPALRFASADDMGAQALGVLRQVLAAQGIVRPAPSTLFGPERTFGDLVSLADHPQWQVLPDPLPDPDSPNAAFLLGITVTGTDNVVAALARAPQPDLDIDLRTVRAYLDGEAFNAEFGEQTGKMLASMLAGVESRRGWDWRLTWYSGVLAFAQKRYADAYARFDELFSELPGELAVRLGMAMAAEALGRNDIAARHYDVVSRTDPAATTAAAGLARARLALGDRRGAVEALARVPETSAAHRPARLAAVRALVSAAAGPGGKPSAGDLSDAAGLAGRVEGTPGEVAALRAEVLEAALSLSPQGNAGFSGLGGSVTDERSLRLELESCYRAVARASEDRAVRIAYVDRANSVRPRTAT